MVDDIERRNDRRAVVGIIAVAVAAVAASLAADTIADRLARFAAVLVDVLDRAAW